MDDERPIHCDTVMQASYREDNHRVNWVCVCGHRGWTGPDPLATPRRPVIVNYVQRFCLLCGLPLPRLAHTHTKRHKNCAARWKRQQMKSYALKVRIAS